MKILSLAEFENNFNDTFGDIDMVSLSNVTNNRIRIELGDDLLNTNQRVKNILFKCNFIFINILKEKDIWLKITFWDNIGKQNLLKAGLDLLQATWF